MHKKARRAVANRLAVVTLGLLCVAGALEGKEIPSERTGLPGALTIKQTFLLRQLGNRSAYPNMPYVLTMSEGNYEADTYQIDAGFLLYKGHAGMGVTLNQMALMFWGDNYDVRIGKFVSRTGVLDYLSGVDVLNPVRADFFDDDNINLRRVPQWMAEVSYFVGDTSSIRVTVEPFDVKEQSYFPTYVGFLLDSYLPAYFEELTRDSEMAAAAYREIFLPLYRDGISPALKDEIGAQCSEHGLAMGKSAVQAVVESTVAGATYGAVWTNRYSEVPYIEVDQGLIDAVDALSGEQNGGEAFLAYLQQSDLTPVKGVRGFRYNQYSLYAESAVASYGIRAEASVRDKVPTLNRFSPAATFGFGIDRKMEKAYVDLEVQWVYLAQYHESALASVLLNRFDVTTYRGVAVRFDHYLISGWYDGSASAVSLPELVFNYDAFEVDLHALYYSNQKEYNTVGFTVRASF